MIDLAGLMLILSLNICIASHADLSMEWLRLFAAIACFFLMTKFGEWCRMYRMSGFFIELLYQTLYDIRGFMIILVVAVLTFGFTTTMLTLNLGTSDDTSIWSFWKKLFPFPFY